LFRASLSSVNGSRSVFEIGYSEKRKFVFFSLEGGVSIITVFFSVIKILVKEYFFFFSDVIVRVLLVRDALFFGS